MNIYISDMDGTLLDPAGRLPKESRELLKKLLKEGLLFTVASARTPLSVIPMLKDLELSVPAILMNGALLYDMSSDRILHMEGFSKAERKALEDAEAETGCRGLLISAADRNIHLNLPTEAKGPWEGYFSLQELEDRASMDMQLRDAAAEELPHEEILYGLYMHHEPGALQVMADQLRQQSSLHVDFYQDRYRDSCWCMEISGNGATKKHGVQRLKKDYPGAYLVGFGDGENDLGLFEACDEGYAVSNACAPLKRQAAGIIDNRHGDGVIRYIKERWERDRENGRDRI